jgi:hypothetical protein
MIFCCSLIFTNRRRCIFQDDETDWSTEASRMSDIYTQASCTIAPTAATDSHSGIFFDRNPEELQPHVIGSYRFGRQDVYTKDIDEAPLNSRAWVCQKRLLSRRIIHLCRRQLFWECHETLACESYPDGLSEWAYPR